MPSLSSAHKKVKAFDGIYHLKKNFLQIFIVIINISGDGIIRKSIIPQHVFCEKVRDIKGRPRQAKTKEVALVT